MKLNKLLAGTLALVLIAGFGTPAFAQLSSAGSIESTEVYAPQHGNVDQSFAGPFDQVGILVEPLFIPSGQTFTPTVDNLVAVDVFFCNFNQAVGNVDLTVNVWNSNTPGSGALLGTSMVTVDQATIDCFAQQPIPVHFDFASIPLVPGNTYSLSFVESTANVGTLGSCLDPYPGGILWQIVAFSTCDHGFVTYFGEDEPEVVGGEFLAIDSAALLIAGLQSSAIWMLPVLAGAAGVGAFYIKTRMNKD